MYFWGRGRGGSPDPQVWEFRVWVASQSFPAFLFVCPRYPTITKQQEMSQDTYVASFVHHSRQKYMRVATFDTSNKPN